MNRLGARGLFFLSLALTVAVVAGLIALAHYRVGDPATITIEPGLPGIGKRTPITVTLTEPGRGLGAISVELIQEDHSVQLAEETHVPRPFWASWGPRTTERRLEIEVGSELQDWLRDGSATIRVVAERAPTWLHRPKPAVKTQQMPVRLRPPTIDVLSTKTYVAQGGSEVVVYRVSRPAVRDGVQAGEWWFPGYPLPGSTSGERFALFAVPYDLDEELRVTLVAVDDVGNRAETGFIDLFFKKPLKTETINVSDGFMAKVVPAILSSTPEIRSKGDLLADFLLLNGELRRRNAETLIELASSTTREFLWKEPFLQMPNTKVMSAFAVRRTYLHDGDAVDQQDHLGFDLASTSRAPIPAANDGIVVLARYFGIYGNSIVLDHGYGLMSLYGHLSSLQVEPGQRVTRGLSLGTSGMTGMAGGDHLHFTMLVHGLPVTPVEWWDSHWIEDRLDGKLGATLPFGD